MTDPEWLPNVRTGSALAATVAMIGSSSEWWPALAQPAASRRTIGGLEAGPFWTLRAGNLYTLRPISRHGRKSDSVVPA